MQWSQIKTLFILCFLVLDIYLFVQFVEKQKAEDIGLLEHEEATIEQKLKEEDITFTNLPEEQPDDSFISVKPKTFTEEDTKALGNLNNQKAAVVNHVILSVFDKPVPVPKDASSERMKELLTQNMIYADEYTFGGWDEEFNVLLFFQKKNKQPIYYNQNGILLVYLNDKHEMVSYSQTMLGDPETSGEKKSIIKPIGAIEKLYENNKLKTGDKITDINLGYHTLVPLENGVQVFVPIWKVTVNGVYYFVDAIEGIVYPTDGDFLIKAIQENLNRLQYIRDDDSQWKETMTRILEKRLKSKSLERDIQLERENNDITF